MSICIAIDDVVKFTVKGTFADRNGKDQPFSFSLTCNRVDTDVIDETIKQGGKYIDFFSEHATDWSGVLDADKKAIAFSAEELQKLFRLPGVPVLTWRRYLEEIGAKAKN